MATKTLRQTADTMAQIGTALMESTSTTNALGIMNGITEARYLSNVLQKAIEEQAEEVVQTMIASHGGNTRKAYDYFLSKMGERPDFAGCDGALYIDKRFKEMLGL